MKINIQKVIKCLTCLVTCFVLVVACMSAPVNAAGILYDPADYITDVSYSGDYRTVTYDFTDVNVLCRVWNDGNNKVDEYSNLSSSAWIGGSYPSNTTTVVFNYFLFGSSQTVNEKLSGNALDVTDIASDGYVDYSLAFDFNATWQDPVVTWVQFKYAFNCFYYDSDGSYLGTIEGDSDTIVYSLEDDHNNALTESYTVQLSGRIPSDAAYLVPFVRCETWRSDVPSDLAIVSSYDSFTMSTQVNMIDAESHQMQVIQGKLDDIISGSPEQNESADNAAGELGDQKNEIEDLIDQMKPTRPDTSVIDTDINAWAGDDATALFADGMANILNHPIILAMLSIVAVVSFIGYVLFGKGV